MSNLVDVGQLSAAYGIKGWVKVRSQTSAPDDVFSLQPWYIKTPHGVRLIELEEWQAHGKYFVAKVSGVDDRSQAEMLCPVVIAVEKSALPVLAPGEYYWHQLHNCRVITCFIVNEKRVEKDLGYVKRMMSTGANDVLVVQGDAHSHDTQERLIPYVPGQFVLEVQIELAVIYVEWDPEF